MQQLRLKLESLYSFDSSFFYAGMKLDVKALLGSRQTKRQNVYAWTYIDSKKGLSYARQHTL